MKKYPMTMAEKILSLETHHPLDIFGAKEVNLKTMKDLFPDLKFVVRGEIFKLIGPEKSLQYCARWPSSAPQPPPCLHSLSIFPFVKP